MNIDIEDVKEKLWQVREDKARLTVERDRLKEAFSSLAESRDGGWGREYSDNLFAVAVDYGVDDIFFPREDIEREGETT